MKPTKKLQLWLNTNQSIRYLTTFGILIILFLGFISSRFLLEKPIKVVETPREESIWVDKRGYQWIQKYISEDKTELAILIGIENENPDNTSNKEIEIKPSLKNMSISNSEVTVLKGSENFYVLTIKQLPKNWETLRVQVGEVGNNDQALLFFNRETEYESNSLSIDDSKFKPTQEYANVYATLFEIEENKKMIQKNVTEKQASIKDEIKKIDTEIEKLNKDLEYKTASERANREQRITHLRKEQDTFRGQIDQLEKNKKEYEERILNLERKLSDQKRAYHISF